jgi:hypothetical protein
VLVADSAEAVAIAYDVPNEKLRPSPLGGVPVIVRREPEVLGSADGRPSPLHSGSGEVDVSKRLTVLRPRSANGVFLFCSDQLLDGDWKAANSNTGGMPHGIGDRPRRAGDADLTNTFDA